MFNVKVVSVPVKVISAVQIKVVTVELYASAKIEVSLLDADKRIIERKALVISGQEYQGWNEDSYLESLILTKLNLTKLPEEPTTPAGATSDTGGSSGDGNN